MAILSLRIENMHCGSCVRKVTQILNGLPETHAEQVTLGAARVASSQALDAVTAALSAQGFPAVADPAGAA